MDLLANYTYPIALFIISMVLIVLEMMFPWRKEQKQVRKMLWSDILYLIFNAHFLGVIFAGVAITHLLPIVDPILKSVGVYDFIYGAFVSDWPMWSQYLLALLVVDFLQWCVHNSLHRIPFFWGMHKVHHSVVDNEMDWIVSFRFQWTEVVVYRTSIYFFVMLLGFHSDALMFHAILGTIIGHFNHSNLNITWGPLKYIFNSPRMHIWHHNYDGDEKTTVNFGITFSFWDYIFGTAYMPKEATYPKLGFAGVEEFPRNFFAQMAYPFWKKDGSLKVAASVVGALLIAFGFVIKSPISSSSVDKVLTPMLGESAAASQPAHAVDFDYPKTAEEAASNLNYFGQAATQAGYKHPEMMVSADEVAHALGAKDLLLIDVRPMERFSTGHIPSARQMTRSDYSQKIPAPGVSKDVKGLNEILVKRGVNSDSVVVLYADGGPEPYRLWWTLKAIANYKVRVLNGGLAEWKKRGHGIAEGEGMSVAAGNLVLSEPAAKAKQLWADIKEFAADAVLLDTRSHAEYTGKKHHRKAARAGRVPGTKHFEWLKVIRAENDRLLISVAKTQELMQEYGIEKDSKVVTMCQSGTRSAAVYFALYQSGVPEEKLLNYDGSWAEYSRLKDLPIEID